MKEKVFCVVGVFLFPAFAEGQPSWVSSPPREDGQYKYYLGRSVPSPSQAEAFRASYEDAVENAVKENYGYSLQIEKSAYEAMDKAALRQKVQEQFQRAEIHGFELRDQYLHESVKGSFEAVTLFRYSKEEIRREQARLKQSGTVPGKELSELRGSRADGGATLIVETVPSNATIEIDGETFGRSDARIRDLAVGAHRVRLEADNFEPVEEEVRLTPGSEVRLTEHLTLSTGYVVVDASLPNAMITVNGRLAGAAPTAPVKVNAGEAILVRAEHPEAEPMLQRITVSRNEKKKVSLRLQPKPSFVVVRATPPGIDVLLGEEKIGSTSGQGTGRFAVPAGERSLEFSKSGFVSRKMEISLHGGETKVLEPVQLVTVAEAERLAAAEREEAKRLREREEAENARAQAAQEAADRDEQARRPWRVLIGLGGGSNSLSNLDQASNYSCCVVLDVALERRWGSLLATRIGYDYRAGVAGSQASAGVTGRPNSSRDLVSSTNGNEVYAGVFARIGQYFYAGPEAGESFLAVLIDHYAFGSGSGSVRGVRTSGRTEHVDQKFLGGRIGVQSNLSEKGIGGYLETSVRSYGDAAPYRGGPKFQVTGGVTIGF